MTDERLAEIENTIECANKNGACEDIYADANWLIQALRAERAKVDELHEMLQDVLSDCYLSDGMRSEIERLIIGGK